MQGSGLFLKKRMIYHMIELNKTVPRKLFNITQLMAFPLFSILKKSSINIKLQTQKPEKNISVFKFYINVSNDILRL